jgi:hypothetical protein
MTTSREDLSRWFDEAKTKGVPFLIVATDTFDYTDFPVYVEKAEDFQVKYDLYNDSNRMLRVMEVYDIALSKEDQLNETRAWHTPPLDAK